MLRAYPIKPGVFRDAVLIHGGAHNGQWMILKGRVGAHSKTWAATETEAREALR